MFAAGHPGGLRRARRPRRLVGARRVAVVLGGAARGCCCGSPRPSSTSAARLAGRPGARGRAPLCGRAPPCSRRAACSPRPRRAALHRRRSSTSASPAQRALRSHVRKELQPLRLVAGAAARRVRCARAAWRGGRARPRGRRSRSTTACGSIRATSMPGSTSACSTATARSRRAWTTASSSSCAGSLREPLLRIDDAASGSTRSSPTAAADGLVPQGGSGWVRSAAARSIAWHDHRLAPPPVSTPGAGRALRDPGRGGRRAGRDRRHVRPRRAAGSLAVARRRGRARGGDRAAARRRPWRAALTIGLGVAGGLARSSRSRRSPSATRRQAASPGSRSSRARRRRGARRAAVCLHGRRRVHAAGVVGAIAAAVSLSSLPVFWHGVVISALPATRRAPRLRARARLRRRGRGAQLPARLRRAACGRCAGDRCSRALALAGRPSVVPWPIGPGPALPAGRGRARGAPVGRSPAAPRADVPGAPRALRRPEGRDRPGRDRRRAQRLRLPREHVDADRRRRGRARREAARSATCSASGASRSARAGCSSFRSRSPVRAYVGGQLVTARPRDPAHAARPDRPRARRLRPAAPVLPLPRGGLHDPRLAASSALARARPRRLRRRLVRAASRRSGARAGLLARRLRADRAGRGRASRPTVSFVIRQPDGSRSRSSRRGPGPHTGVHLIFVRDDLAYIVHKHPPVGGRRRSARRSRSRRPGRYRLVVDVYPASADQQSTRTSSSSGRSTSPGATSRSRCRRREHAGADDGYRFTLHGARRPEGDPGAARDRRRHRPAAAEPPTFTPWFGALAHAIFFRRGQPRLLPHPRLRARRQRLHERARRRRRSRARRPRPGS